jgi:hypothetical protein
MRISHSGTSSGTLMQGRRASCSVTAQLPRSSARGCREMARVVPGTECPHQMPQLSQLWRISRDGGGGLGRRVMGHGALALGRWGQGPLHPAGGGVRWGQGPLHPGTDGCVVADGSGEAYKAITGSGRRNGLLADTSQQHERGIHAHVRAALSSEPGSARRPGRMVREGKRTVRSGWFRRARPRGGCRRHGWSA